MKVVANKGPTDFHWLKAAAWSIDGDKHGGDKPFTACKLIIELKKSMSKRDRKLV